jgi:hypothetical protein
LGFNYQYSQKRWFKHEELVDLFESDHHFSGEGVGGETTHQK